jgi:hypothetical protein
METVIRFTKSTVWGGDGVFSESELADLRSNGIEITNFYTRPDLRCTSNRQAGKELYEMNEKMKRTVALLILLSIIQSISFVACYHGANERKTRKLNKSMRQKLISTG